MRCFCKSPGDTTALYRWVLIVICAVLLANAAQAQVERPERVISLNMCTDQLLVDLAPPGQIIGLSPFAGNINLSWAAGRVANLPVLSGTAEEIIMMKPDLVVAGRYTKRSTREFIRARGILLEEFNPARTFEEAKVQIARFGRITGANAQAESRIRALDAAMIRLKAAASATRLRVLPLSRRGWVSGQDSLITDLLQRAGLSNSATEIGLRNGGFVSLEAIVKLRPDAILIAREQTSAEDQGSAMLLHPALQNLFPPARRIVIPERLTVCGGPMLAEAIDLLSMQVSQLVPRDAALH